MLKKIIIFQGNFLHRIKENNKKRKGFYLKKTFQIHLVRILSCLLLIEVKILHFLNKQIEHLTLTSMVRNPKIVKIVLAHAVSHMILNAVLMGKTTYKGLHMKTYQF